MKTSNSNWTSSVIQPYPTSAEVARRSSSPCMALGFPMCRAQPNSCTSGQDISACVKDTRWKKAVLRAESGDLRTTRSFESEAISDAISAEKVGEWSQALKVLEQLATLQVEGMTISYTSIKTCGKARQWEIAVKLFTEVECQLKLSTVTFNILAGTGFPWQEALMDAMRQSGVEPSVVTSNTAISAFGRRSQWRLALQQLQGRQLDRLSFNAAIAACAKHWQWALQLLMDMETYGCERDVISYNSTISACGKAAQWQLALQIFWRDLGAARLQRTLVTFNAAISACSDWQKALELLNHLEMTPMTPSVVTMSAAISACGTSTEWCWALALLQELCERHPQVDLNEVPFNAAMSACERSGEWQQALLMLSALNSYRLRLSTATCNTVISCLGNAGLWQNALGFLFQQRFRADTISLNAAISASEKAGEWRQAMKVFDQFASLELTPDVLSHNGIISSFEKASQWQRALDILWTLPVGLRPTIITYNAAISALEKAGKWQLAVDLLKVLVDKLLAPTHITYAAAISACEKSGEWERALILLKDTYCLQLQTNIVVYNAAISACEKGGQWQHAWLLLRHLETHRTSEISPTPVTFNGLLSAFEKGNQWRLALQLLRGTTSVDGFTVSAAVSACEKAARWRWALRMLTVLRPVGPVGTGTGGTMGQLEQQFEQVGHQLVASNGAMSACEKSGQWQVALTILHTLKHQRISVSSVSYHAAIGACRRAQQWQMAIQLLADAVDHLGSRLRSDAALSDAAVNACEAACEASAAQETLGAFDVPGLLQQMQREKSAWIILGSSLDHPWIG